jgi:hypothetical protein
MQQTDHITSPKDYLSGSCSRDSTFGFRALPNLVHRQEQPHESLQLAPGNAAVEQGMAVLNCGRDILWKPFETGNMNGCRFAANERRGRGLQVTTASIYYSLHPRAVLCDAPQRSQLP